MKKFLSSSLVFSFLIIITSCSMNDSPAHSNEIAKKYNYFFKAVITEEKKRLLSDADTKAIDDNLTILEKELSSFMTRNCRSESYDMDSKSIMAAEIMVNDNISQALYNLDEKGVMTQFSFNEMLYDNLAKDDSTDNKNITGKTYSVYTFNGKSSGSRSWGNEFIYSRNTEGENNTVTVTEITTGTTTGISMTMGNPELAVDFYTGVYQNLETKDGIVVTGDENNRVITMNNGVEMTVEYDSISDNQKGFKKKFKKAKNKVKEAVKDNGPKVYGVAMITVGVAILGVYYGAALIFEPEIIPAIAVSHPIVTAFALSCIYSGAMSIKDDEYIFLYSQSTD